MWRHQSNNGIRLGWGLACVAGVNREGEGERERGRKMGSGS